MALIFCDRLAVDLRICHLSRLGLVDLVSLKQVMRRRLPSCVNQIRRKLLLFVVDIGG